MADRFPLIIDTADKKLKELPIGDTLKIDGNIIVIGNLTGDVIGNVTGDVVGNLTGNVIGNVTGDVIGNLTGNVIGNVTGDVVGNLTGNVTGNITGAVTVTNLINSSIPYAVLTNTPTIPTDISQLSDSQGILDSVAVEITSQDIQDALGYLPYNGSSNNLGFISEENDTLDSVLQRGNSTVLSIQLNSMLADSIVAATSTINTVEIGNSLSFSNNDQTEQFFIFVEENKLLSIANLINLDTNLSQVSMSGSSFVSNGNITIGTTTNPWSDIYVNNLFTSNIDAVTIGSSSKFVQNLYTTNLFTNNIQTSTGSNLDIQSNNDISIALNNNKKLRISGIGALQLPGMSTAQRNTLTPEQGDMIYNFSQGTVQIYVAVSAWSEGDPALPIPGWVNLYTPPPDPNFD